MLEDPCDNATHLWDLAHRKILEQVRTRKKLLKCIAAKACQLRES